MITPGLHVLDKCEARCANNKLHVACDISIWGRQVAQRSAYLVGDPVQVLGTRSSFHQDAMRVCVAVFTHDVPVHRMPCACPALASCMPVQCDEAGVRPMGTERADSRFDDECNTLIRENRSATQYRWRASARVCTSYVQYRGYSAAGPRCTGPQSQALQQSVRPRRSGT